MSVKQSVKVPMEVTSTAHWESIFDGRSRTFKDPWSHEKLKCNI